MTSTTAATLAITTNLPARLKATAAEPQVKNDTAYYLAHIGAVTGVAAFVNDYRLFAYALKAYGLEDQTQSKGLFTKLLTQGTTDPRALANTLSDPRFKAFAKAFDFAGHGAAITRSAAATTGTVAKYTLQSLDDDAGKQNGGVQLALYFLQNAPAVTNLYGLLADKNLLSVVQTAFGLPTSATADIDAQERALATHVSVADLRNPAKLLKLAERFTAQYDAGGQRPADSVTQVFAASTNAGFSADLLLSVQGLALGGR